MRLRNRGTSPLLPPVCVPHSRPTPGCTGVYFVVCMALLVVSLAETILIVRLVHKQNLQQPVPAWLRHLVLERVALLLCLGEQSTSRRPPATSQAAKTDDRSGETGNFWPGCRDMGGILWRASWAREPGQALGSVYHPAQRTHGGLQPKASIKPFPHLCICASTQVGTERD